MSRSFVRKQVLIEAFQDDDSLPTVNQKIVRVLKSRGNNLHEVETPDKSEFLASMPKRFRGGVWVKKGDFVLVEPIDEGNKVKAEIVRILSTDQIKYYKMNNVWPSEFSVDTEDKKQSEDDLFVNPNRPRVSDFDSSDSSSGSEEEEESSDESRDSEKEDDSSKDSELSKK